MVAEHEFQYLVVPNEHSLMSVSEEYRLYAWVSLMQSVVVIEWLGNGIHRFGSVSDLQSLVPTEAQQRIRYQGPELAHTSQKNLAA